MTVLIQCELWTAEVNIATKSLNNVFSLSSYKRQDTKPNGVYTLLNKFSAKNGLMDWKEWTVRLQPKKNIAKNHININILLNLLTGTTIDTRQEFNRNELRHMNVTKGPSLPYFMKPVKKNVNQVLRKVQLSHSWSRYLGQTPYVVSSPFSVQLLEPTTISMVPTTVQHTVVLTKHTTVKTTSEGTVTRKNMSTKQLRKKLRGISTIPLGVHFRRKKYVVTREVTKKENNNMLPILVKLCTKHYPINCSYREIKMQIKPEVTSIAPLGNNSSRCSTSIATVDKSTATNKGSTESSLIDAIYTYFPPSESYTKKNVLKYFQIKVKNFSQLQI